MRLDVGVVLPHVAGDSVDDLPRRELPDEVVEGSAKAVDRLPALDRRRP